MDERRQPDSPPPASTPPAQSALKARLEGIFAKYPKRAGRSEAVAICEKTLATDEDCERLELAVKAYSDECQGLEPRLVKSAKSFVASWQDYAPTDDELAAAREHKRRLGALYASYDTEDDEDVFRREAEKLSPEALAAIGRRGDAP